MTRVGSRAVDLYEGGTREELSLSSSVPNIGGENRVELPLSAMEDRIRMSLVYDSNFVCVVAFSFDSGRFLPAETEEGRGISSPRFCATGCDLRVVCLLGFGGKKWTSDSD
jgi:hypothetical protein